MTNQLPTPTGRQAAPRVGRRSPGPTARPSGRYVSARPAGAFPLDFALDATLRAAAPEQRVRGRTTGPLRLRRPDLREKVRVRKQPSLVLFLVDASWSMVAAERIEAATGAVLALLTDAYLHRDRVGLVAFQGRAARLLLAPTSSVALARRRLADLQIGGKTPLPAALALARQVIERERRRHPSLKPMLVLLTDGVGNVSFMGQPPALETARLANTLRQDGVAAIVVDAEHPRSDRGYARALAEQLGAACVLLRQLTATELHVAVRRTLHQLALEAS
ncbi:MAG TPA: VWA domain-containing protein [Vicinamibacterales bacterium]|nr:VWA domain-containing protein [Vicinamibacterales bacterium]